MIHIILDVVYTCTVQAMNKIHGSTFCQRSGREECTLCLVCVCTVALLHRQSLLQEIMEAASSYVAKAECDKEVWHTHLLLTRFV